MNQLISHILVLILIVLVIAEFIVGWRQKKMDEETDVIKIMAHTEKKSRLSSWSFWLSVVMVVDVAGIGYIWFILK